MFSTGDRGLARKFLLLAMLFCLATLVGSPASTADEDKPATKKAPSSAAGPSKDERASSRSPAQEESEALDKALEVSPNDPQALIKSLEQFLARFPNSARREQVLRTIYRSEAHV